MPSAGTHKKYRGGFSFTVFLAITEHFFFVKIVKSRMGVLMCKCAWLFQ